MSSSKLLRRISVESPCTASWEEMTGNDQVRFCNHCDLNVNDLSQMTRSKAARFVSKSKGRVCVRIHRDPAGQVITLPAVQKIYSISRRASRFAAGAFTAMMSVSTAAYAQSSNDDLGPQEPPVAEQIIDGPEIIVPTQILTEDIVTGGVMVRMPYLQPLVEAANDSDLERIEQLLADGEDVNKAESDGTTALELAVRNGNVQIVRRLIHAGADVTAIYNDGETILFSLDGDATRELVDILVYAGASVNQPDEEGNTALMNAAESDNAELIRALIDAGAYVNAQNKEGNSALMIAAQYNNAESARVLIYGGAILALRNNEGLDALDLAEANENHEVAYMLMEFGGTDIGQSLPPPNRDSELPSLELTPPASEAEPVETEAEPVPSPKFFCRIPLRNQPEERED